MSCTDFEMNLRAFVRTELMDAAKREGMLRHAEDCLECAERLAGEQALLSGVRAVVSELAEQRAPAYVRSALLVAFREHSLAGNTIVAMPQKVTRTWRLEAVAAAILIATSMGAALWIYSQSHRELPMSQTVVVSPPTTGEPPRPAVKPNETAVAPEIIQTTQSRHRSAKRSTRRAEEVTEFFPLMEGIDLDSLEAVQAVRVELPASALSELGLPAGIETPRGAVRADVLLGIDGVARAIRFVR